MELTATTTLGVSPGRVWAEVADLATYPEWLGVVLTAVPEAGGAAPPAWRVEIGARLGPLRRTKALRMVRTVTDEPTVVRFERVELDGRPHGSWRLEAAVAPSGAGSSLTMDLRYDGGRWLPGLDLLLHEEVRRAGGRLALRLA